MALYTGGDDVMGVVMEFGSYSSKVGYAGDDFPKSFFRSTTAVEKDSGRRCHDFVTRMLPKEEETGHWSLQNPILRGSAGLPWDLDLLSEYMTYASCGHMTREVPVLYIERSYDPPPLRQKILSILMEEQQVPAAFLARDAVCACYSVARTTGTVVDMGHSQTTVSPVVEGYVEQAGIQLSPVGSVHVDQTLLPHLDQKRLTSPATATAGATSTTITTSPAKPLYQLHTQRQQKRSDAFHKLARLDMARQCKESGLLTASSLYYNSNNSNHNHHSDASTATNDDHNNQHHHPVNYYELPDGTAVKLDTQAQSEPIEICYFANPSKFRSHVATKYQKHLESFLCSLSSTSTTTNHNNNNLIPPSSSSDTTCTAKQPIDMMEYLHGNSSSLSSTGLRKTTTKTSSTNNNNNNNNINDADQDINTNTKELTEQQALIKACMPYYQTILPDQQFTEAALPNMVCDSAFACERDQQPSLLGSMIVVGGGSCIPGMTDRLKQEVEELIHQHTPGWRIKTFTQNNNAERTVANWLGGSILASLGSFNDMYITKQEYEEYGSNIVHRKCP